MQALGNNRETTGQMDGGGLHTGGNDMIYLDIKFTLGRHYVSIPLLNLRERDFLILVFIVLIRA